MGVKNSLKPNAVPTLFNVPNPPQLLTPQRLKGIGLPKHRSVTSNFCNGGLLHSLPLSTEAISVAEPSVVHLPQPSASYFGEINFAAEVSDVCLQEQASTSSCDKMPSICEGSHVCLQEQPLASFCNEIPSICEGSDDVLLRNFIKQQTELISLLQCQNKILLKELTATKKKNEINVLKKWHSTEIQLHDLQVQHEELLKGVKTFLSDEQIAMLKIPRRSIAKWSNEGIIKVLKVRFALGKHGYNYLHRIGFPCFHTAL
ncbi:uncharacterized protein LOC118194221 isoform X1 [Stegodyphus dumicola]|uniref:uncharacterized protein LOC118194221 isoform X1 n=1 Tax=Stegodyphus dumicola TaxID=202533 RepID=UPI0015A9F045|nr:uncharacterized protein LOC118194221 isoform X1 [Stegodyphus dumicola]